AAGLPMFPAVPRFDECERGMVEHAMRTDGRSEVYELDATARLLNISTRALVGGGDNVMIAGLILNGTDNGTICFRTLGPSLAAFGVQGVIADPRLDLFNAQGSLALTTIGKTRSRMPSNRPVSLPGTTQNALC